MPRAPTSLTAAAGNGQVKLGWAWSGYSGAKIDRFEYRYSTDGTLDSETWTAIPDYAPEEDVHGGASFTVTGLTNGTAHLFQMRAHNAVGYGEASAAVSATPRAAVVVVVVVGVMARAKRRRTRPRICWRTPEMQR